MLVPEELIDLIFSFLQGEISALESCSKAHPMFSRLAEPYLYEDILLTDADDTDELYSQFCTNPHMLNFPRTLQFKNPAPLYRSALQERFAISMTQIVSMVPRMVNLTSLSFQGDLFFVSDNQYEEFLLTFGICLQESAIEELYLDDFFEFRLCILDNGKNIKKLTLSHCTAANEPIPTSGSLSQSLETLIIRSHYNSGVLVWATRRAANLKTLEFRDPHGNVKHYWDGITQLMACSDSLTRLHFDFAKYVQSWYLSTDRPLRSSGVPGRWCGDGAIFSVTLSNNSQLKELSISAEVNFNSNTRIYCALPQILHLIKTAPSIQDVVIIFDRCTLSETAPIEPLDLSLFLDRLRSDFPASGVRPHIDLHIDDRWAHHPRHRVIPDVLGVRR